MKATKRSIPVRYIEFCYSPATQGYFVWEWTGNVNISRYNWHKITMMGETYAVMTNQELDEATQILRHYLVSDDYGLVSRHRLD